MRALKTVELKFMDEVAECTALFDTGSGATAVQRAFFEEAFDSKWSKLSKPLKLYRTDDDSIKVGKYVQLTIVMDGFELPETVFVIDDFIKEVEVEVEGRRISLPELIVGSGTMDKYGIVLDPKKGVKLTGASLLL